MTLDAFSKKAGSFFRVSKQFALTKIGVSEALAEGPEFVLAMQSYDAFKIHFDKIHNTLHGLIGSESSMDITTDRALSSYCEMEKLVQNPALKALFTQLTSGLREMGEYRKSFIAAAKQLSKNGIDQLESDFLKVDKHRKEYAQVKLEHDCLKRDHQSMVSSSKTEPEKLAATEKQLAAIEVIYAKHQQDLIAEAEAAQGRVKTELVNELVRLKEELTGLYGQLFRILSELGPEIQRLEAQLQASPRDDGLE
eukprot:gnl/Dysnectes_brevis/1387_a1562_3464.p1 GENE.gnl/Dysnectes_brevis/1387_a1562_3464~~gnl/Dysnectes_brevis/1387_a1562_3464.p1  ORF type:complete len:252 (+),score=85.48 gnl/Dysnectes_brevis/1387_a1562_3464:125-880(+)